MLKKVLAVLMVILMTTMVTTASFACPPPPAPTLVPETTSDGFIVTKTVGEQLINEILPNSGIVLQDNALGGTDVIIRNVDTDNVKAIFPELFPPKEQSRYIFVAPAIIIGSERYLENPDDSTSIVKGTFFVKEDQYNLSDILTEMLNFGFNLKKIVSAKFNLFSYWLPAPDLEIDPYQKPQILPEPQIDIGSGPIHPLQLQQH